MSETIKHHPHALIFPMMMADAFDRLRSDIRDNGLVEPIILFEGQILDGRHRYLALRQIHEGFSPTSHSDHFITYEGLFPLQEVVSRNLHRRHLNESQRAIVAAKISIANPGQNRWRQGISSPKAAGLLNVSKGLVNEAKRLIKERPKEIASIEAGIKRIGRHKFDGTISAAIGIELRDKFSIFCKEANRSKYSVLKELVEKLINGDIKL